jgi:spermidine/putrescine transport system permease protein
VNAAPARARALTAYAVAYLIFLYGPVLLLPVFSLNDSIYIAFPLKAFTFNWYRQMAENQELLDALQASLQVGASVAVISTALGMLAAKALAHGRVPGRALVVGFIMLPLIIPSLVMAVALLVVMRQIFDLELSLVTVAAGHVMLCVPYATLVMISRFEGFDRNLEEASRDLGDSAWQSFWRITVPLAWPGILSSLLLCFSASFDEYLFAAFLSGDRATLPLFIFSQLRFAQKLPGVLALGSCILAGSVVLVVVAAWLRRLGLQGSRRPLGL